MNKVELLAPARDKICAKAAIDYGADAIYIAANEFGARKAASNSIQDIKEVTEYAHKFNVKVYVTLNTILSNNELIKAQQLITALEEVNIDALIIQDFGLFSLKHKIPFHASTQCNIDSIEKVKFLEEIGFKRVVLARELSLNEIKNIKSNTNVELEVFIHGALCVCYSGQCYMSYINGKRSANRGECAQPCREKYTLVADKGNIIQKDKHFLALKDFNASNHIKELLKAGVKSFKIEGRLKDVNYVKNTVAYYRQLIDTLGAKKTSWGECIYDFEPNLDKTFNRGYTDYFLEKRKDCFSFDSVNSKGEYVGKVLTIKNTYFTTNAKLNIQDGLCFKNGGCFVNKIEGNKIYPNKMPKISNGEDIYRNYNSTFEKTLKNSKTKRIINAEIIFDENKIIAKDDYLNTAEVFYDFEEQAKDVEKMKANIISSFSKSGNSIYKITKIEFKTDKLPFIPISKLNDIRRNLLEKLETREFNYLENQSFKPATYIKKELDYRENILNDKAKEFYENCGCIVKEPALESGKTNSKGKRIMRCKHCIKYAMGMCQKDIKLFLINRNNKKYELKFNCKKCEMEIYNYQE